MPGVHELAIADWTAKANADLSAKQFLALELTAADTVDGANAATDFVIGILQNKPKSGEAAQVRSWGISRAVASATIAVGDRVGTAATGKLVAKTVAADLVCGIALTAAAADELFSVLLTIGAQRV